MEKSERIVNFLLKSLRKANRAYGLIKDGDRIAIGVSGGKDSQTLLRLLLKWQPDSPLSYQLTAVHIDTKAVWDGAREQTDRPACAAHIFRAVERASGWDEPIQEPAG